MGQFVSQNRKSSTRHFHKDALITDVLDQESVHRCNALLNLFWIFEYVTTGPFGGPLSVNFTHVQKVRQRFSAICILIFKSKTSIKV